MNKRCFLLISILIFALTGCKTPASNVPSESGNAAVTYEPCKVYWSETKIPDFEKTFYLRNEDSPPESCTVLFEKMKLLDMEMPLDSEDRIIAYAWELARMMNECENIEEEETVWYAISAYHYPEGVWLIHYVYRSNVTKMPNGTIRMPYDGGSLTLAVSEDDGEILNAVYA